MVACRGERGRLMDIAGLLDLSDERDIWLDRTLASWRAGYLAGRADAASEAGAAADARWRESWDPEAEEHWKRFASRPAHAELDKLRYPPAGRASWIRGAVA